MSKLIKILHIDPDYQATFFCGNPGSFRFYSITIGQAIHLLKGEDFDLILSEPHNRAYLNPQSPGVSRELRV